MRFRTCLAPIYLYLFYIHVHTNTLNYILPLMLQNNSEREKHFSAIKASFSMFIFVGELLEEIALFKIKQDKQACCNFF